MNKWEREVMESLLSDEAAVLKELKRYYEEALDDIELNIKILQADEQTISRIRRVDYQKALYKQISETLDILHEGEFKTIEEFLNATYEHSFVGTMYSLHGQGMPMILPIDHESAIRAVLTDSKLSEPLYDALGLDINKLKRGITAEITRGIAEGMSNNEIARNIRNTTKAPLARARTIARTESHRIAETASNDAGKQAISKGADVVKQWDASLDDATRDTHRQLDGKIVEFDEDFVSGTRKALYPGQFGDPAEDCNCRCNALKRSRSKMNEDELKVLKERAEFFGLDKTDDFKDFEKKYLKASKSIENSDNYGIIKGDRSAATAVKKENNSVVNDAIKNGTVSKKINPNKQNRHIRESGEYIEGRSYIYGTLDDAQNLVDELSGTGSPILDANGKWTSKERVINNSAIGVFVDIATKKETETRLGIIIYSKTGSHIIPRKE